MLAIKPYQRERVLEYAEKWALTRNPLFTDYTGKGGNCTNFVSQCIYAGSCTMNYTPVFGWYYLTDNQRAPAWTGVVYLFNFLLENEDVGPYGTQVGEEEAQAGDVIQLYRQDVGWYHTLLMVGRDPLTGTPLVAAQSDDAYNRPLDTYIFDQKRFVHILGVRQRMPDIGDCFESLNNGVAIIPQEEMM